MIREKLSISSPHSSALKLMHYTTLMHIGLQIYYTFHASSSSSLLFTNSFFFQPSSQTYRSLSRHHRHIHLYPDTTDTFISIQTPQINASLSRHQRYISLYLDIISSEMPAPQTSLTTITI
ncbi:hypothetical protein BsWGS_17347 [Bradybaena similaris]